ncbi:MAG: hypothetical protein ABFD60_08100 [Bryobacteraceae bacterium]
MGEGNQAASWRKPRILLSLALIFLCGAASGALVMRFVVHGVVHDAELSPGSDVEKALDRMTKDLDLTSEQRRELETVLDDFVMYVQSTQAQMEEVRATGKQRILRILNEKQRQKFEKMLTEVHARRTSDLP